MVEDMTVRNLSPATQRSYPGQSHMEFTVVEGWLHLLGSGAINSDRGCRNAEEPASVRSFARIKGSSVVNHLPDFSYAIAQRSYLYAVAKFSRFFGKSPERLEL